MKTIKIGGAEYKIEPFNLKRDGDRFLTWAKTKITDPVDQVARRLNELPKAVHKELLADAFAQARIPITLTHPEVLALQASSEGVIKLISYMFLTHHPNLTEEDVYQLILLGQEEYGQEAFGKMLAS